VAPAAKLFLLPVPDSKKLYDEKMFSYIKKYTTEYFTKNSIVNASFGVEYPKHHSFQPLKIWQQNTFSELLQNNCLIIQSAGNDGIPLTRSEVGKFLRDLFSQNISHALLIAGSVDPTYSIAHYSNTPGDNPIFQEKFLCTLGTNIPIMSTGRPTTPSGTSLSAPAISGVAALILSSHPTFSMEEVASTLLESAEKNFFIPSSESGNTGTFIYEDSPPSIKKKSMVYQLFDPSIYGRGILSVRRAFIYADIYEEIKKEMPTATPKKILEKTKTAFNLVIKEIDRAAATKIQTTARGFLARKKLKRVIIE
jgi:subtilisin family serine protease